MAFPPAAVVLPAALPALAIDGSAVATGSALGGAGNDDPGDGAVPAEAADVPPRLAR